MPVHLSDPQPGPEHVHFGHQLREWRIAAGLTQAELGQRLAYDHSFISRLERGYRWPTKQFALRCDEILGAGGVLVIQWRRADLERRAAARVVGPGTAVPPCRICSSPTTNAPSRTRRIVGESAEVDRSTSAFPRRCPGAGRSPAPAADAYGGG
jgi:DNA-binding XRE family transcriptional regulator